MRRRVWWAVAMACAAAGGCRAQVGLGVGLGAGVKLPLIAHLGAGAGHFTYVGPWYGPEVDPGQVWETHYALAPAVHGFVWRGEVRHEHVCAPAIPVLSLVHRERDIVDLWTLGLWLDAGPVSVVLELCPGALYRRRD